MSVTVTEQNYENYGKCVFLDNGKAKVGVTVEVGPRVIYFALNGRKNIMLEDIDRNFTEETVGGYGTWINYGGHRLWCSPEVNPETYSPDNDPVEYSIDGNKLTVTPKPTPFGKAFSMVIELDENEPVVTVCHKIKNVSGKPARFAPWAITGLTVGGVCKIPMSKAKTGYLANRVISLWDYAQLDDPRFKMTDTEIRIRQDVFKKNAFKIGLNVDEGFGLYAVNEQIFVKVVPEYKNVEYPDFSCNFECYTNSKFLEVENIGEIKEYQNGEEAVLCEKWVLLDNEGDNEPCLNCVAEKIKGIRI